MYDRSIWDGCPEHPETSGWHWIEDGDGLRPLLWRGGDWLEQEDRGEWQDGFGVLSARSLSRGRCYGPVVPPAGFDPVAPPISRVGSWRYLQAVWRRRSY